MGKSFRISVVTTGGWAWVTTKTPRFCTRWATRKNCRGAWVGSRTSQFPFRSFAFWRAGITSFPLAMATGGAFQATIGWLVGGLFALLVAACLGQIASAYPTAGALYHWSSILGGRGWGWATAWINLLGLIFVVASVDVGVWQLFRDLVVAGVFHVDVTNWTAQSTDPLPTGMTLDQVTAINNHAYYVQVAAVALIVGAQAVVNHFGIKLTTLADRLLRLPDPCRRSRADGNVLHLGCREF